MLFTGDPESGIIDEARRIVTDDFTANSLRQLLLRPEAFSILFFCLMDALAAIKSLLF